MTPGEASKQGALLEIDHPYGGKRYPAQLFDIDQGVAWIEYGWAEDDPLERASNPIHMAQGLVKATPNGWEIPTDAGRPVTIRRLDDHNDSDLIEELKTYNRGDRYRARDVIQQDLSLTIPSE
ncbi:hypothetical protein [Endozoicomonas sp.]|uniref:hypothetical protein n=1 Tax=Endozoicomonas sp. TaxID=1892382 RepID=UPI003AF493DA